MIDDNNNKQINDIKEMRSCRMKAVYLRSQALHKGPRAREHPCATGAISIFLSLCGVAYRVDVIVDGVVVVVVVVVGGGGGGGGNV